MVEFKAMAFRRSSPPTISLTKDCLVGASKAFTNPKSKARIITCQTFTSPVKVRNARTKARVMAETWVRISSFLFLTRSASTPAGSEKKKTGSVPKAPTTPKRKAELESSKTSQA